VAYLNGSKVLTTGSALVFDGTNLGVGISPASDGAIHVHRSGASFPTIKITNGTTGSGNLDGFDLLCGSGGEAYVFNRESQPLIFGVSNTEQMRLTSTGLGIGTSSPAAKLDVFGSGIFDTFGTGGSLAVNAYGALVGRIRTPYSGTAYNIFALDVVSGGSIVFSNNNAERMRIDASGNLGLGVTPSAWRSGTPAFQIGSAGVCAFADSGVTAELGNNVFLNSSSQYIYLRTDAASRYRQYQGVHSWLTAGSGTAGTAIGFSTAMTLDASGNLGIGTTTIGSRLTIGDPGTGLAFSNAASGNFNLGLLAGTGSAEAYVYQRANAALLFGTNNTERARIDSSGNLLVGLASATGVAKLQVSGPLQTTGYTVATLPAGTVGMRTYVTDALAPAFGVAVAGSGAVTIPVFYDGANWIVA
jgi:hypothetical protein